MAKLIFVVLSIMLIGSYGQQDDANTTTSEPATTTEPITTTVPPTTAPPTTVPPTTVPPTTAPPTTAPPTTAPPTTTPQPSPDEFFRVTEENITCVIYGGDISFSVSFKQNSGKIGHATVHVPQPSKDVYVTGSCNASVTGRQNINITWGPTNAMSSFQLQFNATSSGSKWMLTNVTANLFLDEAIFLNATDHGKFLFLAGEFPGLNNVAVDTNSSLTCVAAVDSKNFSAEVGNGTAQGYTVTGNAVGVRLQAFNSIPNMKDLQQVGTRCEADITSDLVPIAVGCALAGLVLLVLVSYLVGRRRRAAAYQSV